jgi:hypothetical protein
MKHLVKVAKYLIIFGNIISDFITHNSVVVESSATNMLYLLDPSPL